MPPPKELYIEHHASEDTYAIGSKWLITGCHLIAHVLKTLAPGAHLVVLRRNNPNPFARKPMSRNAIELDALI